jgi:hypothetical protein
VYQFPAFIRFVEIKERRRDIVDIHGHGVTEQNNLDDRGHEKKKPHFLVPEYMEEFLNDNLFYPFNAFLPVSQCGPLSPFPASCFLLLASGS